MTVMLQQRSLWSPVRSLSKISQNFVLNLFDTSREWDRTLGKNNNYVIVSWSCKLMLEYLLPEQDLKRETINCNAIVAGIWLSCTDQVNSSLFLKISCLLPSSGPAGRDDPKQELCLHWRWNPPTLRQYSPDDLFSAKILCQGPNTVLHICEWRCNFRLRFGLIKLFALVADSNNVVSFSHLCKIANLSVSL